MEQQPVSNISLFPPRRARGRLRVRVIRDDVEVEVEKIIDDIEQFAREEPASVE